MTTRTMSPGQRLQASFAATLEGGGWAEAPDWDDFTTDEQARWERAAEHYNATLNRPAPAASADRATYTIAQIDDALRAICGLDAVRPHEGGWSRPLACVAAASRAFVDQRPEDEHTARLRAAIQDLNTKGMFDPLGGWRDGE